MQGEVEAVNNLETVTKKEIFKFIAEGIRATKESLLRNLYLFIPLPLFTGCEQNDSDAIDQMWHGNR